MKNNFVIGMVGESRGDKNGLIIPKLIKGTNDIYEHANPNDFPNNGHIFVVSEFQRLKEHYANQLFKIPFMNNQNYEYEKDLDAHSLYLAKGETAKPIEYHELCHVISTAIPDVEDRIIKNLNFKPKRYIFLEDLEKTCFYGPFKAEVIASYNNDTLFDIRLDPLERLSTVLPRIGDRDWGEHILAITHKNLPENLFLHVTMPTYTDKLLSSIACLADLEYDVIDYMSNEKLVRWGNELFPRLNQRSLDKQSLQKILDLLKSRQLSAPNKVHKVSQARIERLTQLLYALDAWEKEGFKYVEQYLATAKGKEHITAYIEAHSEKILELSQKRIGKEIQEKIEAETKKEFEPKRKELETEIKRLQQQIESLSQNRNKLKDEIESLQNDKKQVQQNKKNPILMVQTTQLESEKTEQIQELEKKIDELKKLSHYHEIHESKLAEKRKITEELLHQSEQALKRKLTETHALLELLLPQQQQYHPLLSSPEKIPTTIPPTYPTISCRQFNGSMNEYLTELSQLLRQTGRNYSQEQIANFVINIQQNFLTVFAGLPGVGKTSLVKLLGDTLGLSERFLTIRTARGWTSQRDLLGYFNPLAHQFQKAPTGLFDILKQIEHESTLSSEMISPYFVLLDEANLSPIEHYWSSFMGMCDHETEKVLYTGIPNDNNSALTVGEHLRFLATINYDHSTEQLSPRLIDRAPIILLDPPAIDEFSSTGKNLTQKIEPISYADLNTWFDCANGQAQFSTLEETEITKIIRVLQENTPHFGSPIIVSHRKKKAMQKYCYVARRFMGRTNLIALDYAVTQHLLPLINGYGEKYGARLNTFYSILSEQFVHTKAKLKEIIAIGESEQHSYSYFMH